MQSPTRHVIWGISHLLSLTRLSVEVQAGGTLEELSRALPAVTVKNTVKLRDRFQETERSFPCQLLPRSDQHGHISSLTFLDTLGVLTWFPSGDDETLLSVLLSKAPRGRSGNVSCLERAWLARLRSGHHLTFPKTRSSRRRARSSERSKAQARLSPPTVSQILQLPDWKAQYESQSLRPSDPSARPPSLLRYGFPSLLTAFPFLLPSSPTRLGRP